MRHSVARATLAGLALAAPAAALANTGIGLFFPAAVVIVPALVVVIPLEAAILWKALGVSFRRALWLAFLANMLSTILGAMIGIALDVAIGTGTGFIGLGGREGFLLSLAAMFAITVWLEHIVVRRKQAAVAKGRVLRAVLAANAASYALLALAVPQLIEPDPTIHRARMTEAVSVGGVAKTDAAEYFHANGRFRAAQREKPTQYTRRVTTTDSGRITVEIDYPALTALDGQALVLEPELHEGRIQAWHCYVPQAPFKYFPANCRFRSAAESAKVYGGPR